MLDTPVRQDMPIGAFVEKQHQPTVRQISHSIGPKKELWDDLERFVAENYRTKSDFAFYGKNYGWALRFRKAGKALLSMYPGEGVFTVQVVLGEALARHFPERRWLFIKVNSKQDRRDIQQLLLLKEPSSQI